MGVWGRSLTTQIFVCPKGQLIPGGRVHALAFWRGMLCFLKLLEGQYLLLSLRARACVEAMCPLWSRNSPCRNLRPSEARQCQEVGSDKERLEGNCHVHLSPFSPKAQPPPAQRAADTGGGIHFLKEM